MSVRQQQRAMIVRRTSRKVEDVWQRLKREREARIAGCTHEHTKLVVDPTMEIEDLIIEGGRRRVCLRCSLTTEWLD